MQLQIVEASYDIPADLMLVSEPSAGVSSPDTLLPEAADVPGSALLRIFRLTPHFGQLTRLVKVYSLENCWVQWVHIQD